MKTINFFLHRRLFLLVMGAGGIMEWQLPHMRVSSTRYHNYYYHSFHLQWSRNSVRDRAMMAGWLLSVYLFFTFCCAFPWQCFWCDAGALRSMHCNWIEIAFCVLSSDTRDTPSFALCQRIIEFQWQSTQWPPLCERQLPPMWINNEYECWIWRMSMLLLTPVEEIFPFPTDVPTAYTTENTHYAAGSMQKIALHSN